MANVDPNEEARMLHNLLFAMEPGGIENQEKQGQTQFVNSTLIPIESPIEDLKKIRFSNIERI